MLIGTEQTSNKPHQPLHVVTELYVVDDVTMRARAHLLSREARPRLEAVGEHLPQRDAVRPDVRGRGEGQVTDGLGRAPGDGQLEVDVEVRLVVVLAHA